MDYPKVDEEDLRFFKGLLGEENVSIDPWEISISTFDVLAGLRGKAEAVLWPSNKDQIPRILEYCTSRRIPVTPRAGGTSTSGNATPLYGGVVLNMRKLNRVIEVIPEDSVVIVEPGVVYDDLNRKLERYGLFFPPEPASSRICTVGGMVANNASGLRAVKYGVTRDYVMGLEVVLPVGRTIEVGTLAPKSSIGYDLVRLFAGSEGTLGVFTKIALKLRTLPEVRRSGICYFGSAEEAGDAVARISHSNVEPSAIEYLDSATLGILIEEGYPYELSEAALLMETDGNMREAEEGLLIIRGICEGSGGRFVEASGRFGERLWDGRRAIGAILVRRTSGIIKGDIDVPRSKLTWMIGKAYRLASEYEVRVIAFGHAGDGNIHLNIMIDRKDEDSYSRAKAYYRRVLEETVKVGGAISGEHGIGVGKLEFMKLQHGEDVVRLMKEIKGVVDPAWIMNPGKMIEGS